MKLGFLVVAMLSLLSCASVHGKLPATNVINVLYSLSIDQNGVLELSVYNPTSQRACTSYLNWPGLGDTLRVIGRDNKEWNYVGLEVSVVGRPKDLKITSHSEVSTRVDLRKNYQPVSAETRIGKVYYGTQFHAC